MKFASRHEAGRKLGLHLLTQGIRADVVLGLPRGGVIVAAEVAKALACPLDIVVVRKIGHPRFREFAVGALAEAEIVVLDESALKTALVQPEELEEVISEEQIRLNDHVEKFGFGDRVALPGKSVIVVDDGIATGATTEAAVQSARRQGAKLIIVGSPVASDAGFKRLVKVADQVITLRVDPAFEAVGQYYWSFPQTRDDEVITVLKGQLD
jgi:putative phosphoribosyl transferase